MFNSLPVDCATKCWHAAVDELLLLQTSELALCCSSLTMRNSCRKFVLSWWLLYVGLGPIHHLMGHVL